MIRQVLTQTILSYLLISVSSYRIGKKHLSCSEVLTIETEVSFVENQAN